VAEAIERVHAGQLESHASVLAHHLYQAGAAADVEKTVLWLDSASRQAAASAAFEDALDHLDNALSLLAGEQTVRVGQLYAQRATLLRSLGRMQEAVVACERALTLFHDNGDAHRFAETCLPLVEIYWWTVRLEEAREVCTRGLKMLGQTEHPLRLFLTYAMGGGLAALANDIDTAIPLFRAVEGVAIPPDPLLVRTAAGLRAMAKFTCAEVDAAYRAATETRRLSETAGDLWRAVDVAWV
jgi:tetratricopeptide (TPR) repeat protein